MTPGLLLTATAVVLAIGSLSTGLGEGRGHRDVGCAHRQRLCRRKSRLLAERFRRRVRFRRRSSISGPSRLLSIAPLFDPDRGGRRRHFFPETVRAFARFLSLILSLNSPPERRVRVKRHPNCSSGAANIVRCSFYDADLLLLSGESWNNSSNQAQPGQNPPVSEATKLPELTINVAVAEFDCDGLRKEFSAC